MRLAAFSERRGRPRRPRYCTSDTGTPELIFKRLSGETAEVLDLCLARDIITPSQHWCGIHLRWLYTLRYGAPGLRAIDPMHFGGREMGIDHSEWRKDREEEYQQAIAFLHARGLIQSVLNCCVFDERPAFLRGKPDRRLLLKERERQELQEGLQLLVKLWCPPPR